MTENYCEDRGRDVLENLRHIQENIANAARKAGRSPEEITLLAATKTVPVQLINFAISHGVGAIGENRVQELLEKYDALDRDGCDLQFIGKLQSNKVKYIVDKVSCVQSVDSRKLATELSKAAVKAGRVLNILVEVNIGKEESKGGVYGEDLLEFIDSIRNFEGIRINGLMTIPPICDKKSDICAYFEKMRQYYVDIKTKKIDNVYMNCLSMGMSEDYIEAVENGATMVRIGSALFGRRLYH